MTATRVALEMLKSFAKIFLWLACFLLQSFVLVSLDPSQMRAMWRTYIKPFRAYILYSLVYNNRVV